MSVEKEWALLTGSSESAAEALKTLHDFGNKVSPHVDIYLMRQINSSLADIMTNIRAVGLGLDQVQGELESKRDKAYLGVKCILIKAISPSVDPLEQIRQSTYGLDIILRIAEL